MNKKIDELENAGMDSQELKVFGGTLNLNDYYKQSADGKGMYSVAEIKLDHEYKGKSTMVVKNIDAIIGVEKIKKALIVHSTSSLVICRELYKLASNEKAMLSLGVKTNSELGSVYFGFASATSNSYIKIGGLFIDDDYNLPLQLQGLTHSHLLEILTFFNDKMSLEEIEATKLKIYSLFEQEILSTNVSTKKLRASIEDYKKSLLIETDKSDVDEEEKEENKQGSASGDSNRGNTAKKGEYTLEMAVNELNVMLAQVKQGFTDLQKFDERLVPPSKPFKELEAFLVSSLR